MNKIKTIKKKTKSQEEIIQQADSIIEDKNLLSKKTKKNLGTAHESEDDSSDEELVVRTGNVPRKWYDSYDHAGYDINSNRVIKPKQDDEIEKFLKKAEDKNWWRNIYDEMNNKTIYISDKDLELIQRIRKNLFADRKADEEDYFEKDVPKQIHPLSNHMPPKKAFEMSKNERKSINRLVYLYKNGFLKFEDEIPVKKDVVYDLWNYENTDPNRYHPGKGFQPPKRELPDTDVSYNPPDEIVGEEIKQFSSLRKIPKFEKLMDENFERCCDLFLSARMIRKKLDIKEEDLLPQLPKPEELKPFPTKENITFRGHESSIRSMAVDPKGKFLISGDNAGFVYIWDILTAKIIKRFDISDNIVNISYNNILNLITICGKQSIYFVAPHYLEKKLKKEMFDAVNNKIQPLIREKTVNPADASEEKKEYEWKVPKKGSPKERNGVLFYLKWKEGSLENLTWHNKGDYFSTLSKNAQGKSQVMIHSLSRLVHQTPFSKIKGNINAVSFHPSKPYFIVATNSNIFVYNLQKQEMIRKFVSNLNTITHINIHKNGDDILAGTRDGKVAWFQLELSEKPFKIMDYHGDKIKGVAYHNQYPLFSSCSRNGKLLVYHATISSDLIQDPVIVPLKVLKPEATNNVLTSSCFHPKHPWIFTSGEDNLIRMWS